MSEPLEKVKAAAQHSVDEDDDLDELDGAQPIRELHQNPSDSISRHSH
jgi:hypothetical protein